MKEDIKANIKRAINIKYEKFISCGIVILTYMKYDCNNCSCKMMCNQPYNLRRSLI